jgi:hypothetical protein
MEEKRNIRKLSDVLEIRNSSSGGSLLLDFWVVIKKNSP